MGKYTSILTVILLLAGVSLPSLVPPPVGAWSTDPTANTLISKGGYWGMAMCSDGFGGVVVVSAKSPSRGDPPRLRAERLDATGSSRWSQQHVAVCPAESEQDAPVIVNDGLSGTIIGWRGIGIRAQKLDDSGKRQWADDGVSVARADFPVMTPDGLGGAIIVWHSSGDLYSQRLGSDGTPRWAANGVAVYTGGEQWLHPMLVSDGLGGAIIAWYDGSAGRGEDNRVYAQRLDAEGVPQWTPNGEVICSVPGDQRDLAIASDGSGGAIIAWNDKRSPDGGIYAQRIDSTGELQWDDVGVLIRRDAHSQPALVGDGTGGAVIALATGDDLSESETSDIYAQKLDSGGKPQWSPNGVAVCTAPNNQIEPVAVSDGSGGVIIAWQDGRVATGTDRGDELWDWGHANILHNDDIYAQRLSSAGSPQWVSDGVAVCTAPHLQRGLQMVANGSGGAVIGWADFRDYPLAGMRTDLGYVFDWYVQGVDASGSLGPASSDGGLSLWIVIAVACGAVSATVAGTLVWQRRRATRMR